MILRSCTFGSIRHTAAQLANVATAKIVIRGLLLFRPKSTNRTEIDLLPQDASFMLLLMAFAVVSVNGRYRRPHMKLRWNLVVPQLIFMIRYATREDPIEYDQFVDI